VAYERALTLDAEFAPAYRGLGEVAEGLGEPRAAAQAYVDYLRKDPDVSDRAVILQRLRTLRDQLRTEETDNAATNR
jgi:predicted TPR repeat methyltransferase